MSQTIFARYGMHRASEFYTFPLVPCHNRILGLRLYAKNRRRLGRLSSVVEMIWSTELASLYCDRSAAMLHCWERGGLEKAHSPRPSSTTHASRASSKLTGLSFHSTTFVHHKLHILRSSTASAEILESQGA